MKRAILALALGAAVLAPVASVSGSAAAVADTCRGLPATLVGTPGEVLTGTEGADVILSNNARRVDALGGDDTVCLTNHDGSGPNGHYPAVDAGEGDDDVDATAVPSGLEPGAELGSGADSYVGGPAQDVVYAAEVTGEIGTWVVADEDQDVIETAGGRDEVYTGADGPLEDRIDLGGDGGGLNVAATSLDPTGRLDVGAGSTLRFLRADDSVPWTVDTAQRTATEGGPGLRWTGTAAIQVWGDQPVRFRGSSAPDQVLAQRLAWASLGGGNDSVTTLTWETGLTRRLLGGAGSDRLAVASVFDPSEYNVRDRITYDVSAGEASFEAVRGDAEYAPIEFTGFERHYVEGFDRAVVRGTAGADQLVIGYLGREGTVHGGGGDDRIGHLGNGSTLLGGRARLVGGPGRDTITNIEVTARIEGGPGADFISGGGSDDEMYGNDGDDVLLGGNGIADRAWGGRGRDRCVAEQRTGCES